MYIHVPGIHLYSMCIKFPGPGQFSVSWKSIWVTIALLTVQLALALQSVSTDSKCRVQYS